MKLMDYSLLIGIHDCDRALREAEEEQAEENGQHVSTVHIYYRTLYNSDIVVMT